MRNGLALTLVTVGSLLLSALSGPLAYAAGAGDPAKGTTPTPDEARAEAEKRLNEGLDRYAKGDFEGARLAFAQAYAVLVSIDLLYNLTRAELKSGHPLEALVHIHQLLRNPNATTDDRAKAERLREEANRATGHIAVEAPDGAAIALDHVPSGEAPVTETYDVVPGKHVVEVKANGSTRTIELDAPPGQLVTARFAVEVARPPTAGPPVPVGPPATALAPQPEPPPAEHHHHESTARIVVPVVLGVLGVAGLGVGIGMGVASQGQQSNATNFRASHEPGFCANQASAVCSQYAGILNSQQTDTNVSRVFLVSGGVLAAAAVVTYFAWPHGGKERAAWVAPTPGGVVVGGAF